MVKKSENTIQHKKIGNTRIVPITNRIVIIFVISILVTSFVSNYINLVFNRAELINMMKELLVKDLKLVYDFSNSQYEIYQYSQDEPEALNSSMKAIASNAIRQHKNNKSITLGLRLTGNHQTKIIFQASKIPRLNSFTDNTAIERIENQQNKSIRDGALTFYINNEEYYGVYKYVPKWDFYLLRAEELNEFYQGSRLIFRNISIIIALITLICTLISIYFIRHITRFIDVISDAILKMIHNQQMGVINLEGATNDNITFMGMAFNSLSSSINNLLAIFRRFVNQDVAVKAYEEKIVRLEGTQKELTVLFSDIKSFTFMTETLGTDIISILNLHYHRAIRAIFQHGGLIGSLIGDAVLAVFGINIEDEQKSELNKSYQAIIAGYEIQKVAATLRKEMEERRLEIIRLKGSLTEEEERIYQAVLVEVGVGIDGGNVFYGNIGSYERMANTVIGDNVNAASRLEGLTRIYKTPVICSEYVKNDIEQNQPDHDLYFLELDTVQVKGKTIGKKIFWPIPATLLDSNLKEELKMYESGLTVYYQGQWQEANTIFAKINIPAAEEFAKRTRSGEAPGNWSGIWNIETK